MGSPAMERMRERAQGGGERGRGGGKGEGEEGAHPKGREEGVDE